MYRSKSKLTNLLILLMLSSTTLMLSCSKDVKHKSDGDQEEVLGERSGDPKEIFTSGSHSDKLNYLIHFIEGHLKGRKPTYAARKEELTEITAEFINTPDSLIDLESIENLDHNNLSLAVQQSHLDKIWKLIDDTQENRALYASIKEALSKIADQHQEEYAQKVEDLKKKARAVRANRNDQSSRALAEVLVDVDMFRIFLLLEAIRLLE